MGRRGAAGDNAERKPRRENSKRRSAPAAAGDAGSAVDSPQERIDRLAAELAEAHEQQAATADVLKVISRSTFDLQAVLNTLVESAGRLCQAENVQIFLRDGEVYRLAAYNGFSPKYQEYVKEHPIMPGRGTLVARTALEVAPVHIPDVLADPEYTWHEGQRLAGFRAMLGVPMLREEGCVGVMAMTRAAPQPFAAGQIALATTFADQALIAIENARLFEEVQTHTRKLTEALQRQTASNEILSVISRSKSTLQPVLDAIVATAAWLCQAEYAVVQKFENGAFHFMAANNPDAEYIKYSTRYPPTLNRGSLCGRVVLERATIQIPDVLQDPEYARHDAQRLGKYRTLLGVPLLRDGEPIGVLYLIRTEARPFAQEQIELVQSFADQAVIAIENVRMFNEIQDKTRQVEQQAAQLADWNRTLETRVAEQVSQLTRLSKLTRFLSPKISELIMSGEVDDPLATRRSEITVVYADLRGFTGFTETADPEDVMSVLREYHAELGRAIMTYDGTIEHFAGDGAMVLFNAPVPVADHEARAIRMALQMRESLAVLASSWRKRGFSLGFGAGIATGYVTLGTIGFEERLDYGAIGTVCNLASRLCGEAADGQILISPRAYARVESMLEAEGVGELSLKGFHRPVVAYNVLRFRAEPAARSAGAPVPGAPPPQ